MDVSLYLWCCVGIAISVVLPVIWVAVRQSFPAPASTASVARTAEKYWPTVKPYLLLGLASALTGLIVFAVVGDQITTWKAAMLAGYAWDSTLQKLRK